MGGDLPMAGCVKIPITSGLQGKRDPESDEREKTKKGGEITEQAPAIKRNISRDTDKD